ncbi:LytTR family DNA-binding domain-containing protein [Algoriphagus sp. D3-2-R+10]|uniref:LytR/AlgR family response regulator transcription factor n=1 Tax=Algoriphagus aurantiacus TaxID=3103948 RepID=UPI002B366904|nr:LytTR family DNA-binding domain-containing protein [Algoriphagus sp. D3-2-R+10]MEB2773944.1 LytTR family DNA-binding domain-containing protein [Algoriphagus sp. D3-2-R+10]
MSPIFQQKKLRIKATLKYLAVLVLILLVTIFQDYLHSQYNDYSFYASESFLFNMFWILILPVSIILNGFFNKVSALAGIRVLLAKRLLFVIFASIFHILIFAGLVHIISALFYGHTFTFFRNLNYTISADLYKYLLIYSVISLVLLRKNKSIIKEVRKSNYLDQILVGSGRTKTAIKTSDVFFISAEAPYIAIHTINKKLLHSSTLKSILDQLNPDKFVRIHKSTIVNLNKVISYKSRLNGDYDIQLSNSSELRLSRNYVDNFKERFSSLQSS